ncbi:hypothetical protein IGI04_042974, partial [Brassica rapa subsp. trilocularis]
MREKEGSVQLKINQVKIRSDGKQVNVPREGERNKVADLEYSRFSPRRPVPSNRLFYTIVTQKLCPNDFVPVIFKDSFSAGGWTIWVSGDRILPIERRNTMSPGPRFPLLEARSWQEAKFNLVTFMTLTGLSLARHVALPDHGVGLDGQSCSCLIVGWPVGSFISNPGCWTVDRSCSCLIVGRLIDHMSRTVRGCYRGGIRASQNESQKALGKPVTSSDRICDRYSTEKASSVQSAILYDCDAEALSNSIRPTQSVEVLLDTLPGSPKNCPEARGGSVRVQISLSRPVNFFMVKPRLCPRQYQSIPVQSRRPLGFGQVFSDQPAASRLEHCELVPVIFKDSFSAGGWTIWVTLLVLRVLGHIGRTTGAMCFFGLVPSGFKETPYLLDREDSERRDHGLWLSDYTTSVVEGYGTLEFPLLEARSWQEAKSNFVTVSLGKDDRIASCWTLGPPVSWTKVYDSDRIAPSPSRSASGPWCWVGQSVMFLFDCWLAGWPFISNPWCGSSVGH